MATAGGVRDFVLFKFGDSEGIVCQAASSYSSSRVGTPRLGPRIIMISLSPGPAAESPAAAAAAARARHGQRRGRRARASQAQSVAR